MAFNRKYFVDYIDRSPYAKLDINVIIRVSFNALLIVQEATYEYVYFEIQIFVPIGFTIQMFLYVCITEWVYAVM